MVEKWYLYAVLLFRMYILFEPLTDLPQILNGELSETAEIFLVWFQSCMLGGFILLSGKLLVSRQSWLIPHGQP